MRADEGVDKVRRGSRVVVFGTYRRDLHPRVAVLIDGLRANGAHVVELNEPLPLDTAARVDMLHRPWRVVLLVLTLVRCWSRLWRRARKEAHRADLVLVGYMGHFDIHLARLCFPGVPIVLDHMLFAADTARDRGRSDRWVQAVLERLDGAALRAASTVLVDTDEHAAMAVERGATDVVIVPVGAEQTWFEVPDLTEVTGPLRVLFFGLFTPLQGTPVIAEAVRLLPEDTDVAITLVGRGQEHDLVATMLAHDPRVTMIDWVPGPELVRLVADHHVVLGIFGSSDKAMRVVPTKVYQGLAAGRAVVSSDTPCQRAAVGDVATLVPPDDPAALAAALVSFAEDRSGVVAAGAAARRHAADRFTPEAVTRDVLPRNGAAPAVVLAPLSPMGVLRWRTVRPILDRVRPSDVLEVGCGQGAAGVRIAALPTVDYTGVEPDEDSYSVAADRLAGLGTVINGDDSVACAMDRRWDLVCAFEVLEHIEDDHAALRRWHSLCADNGHLLLSVPAWQARFGASDTLVGHYRRYSPTSIAEVLRQNGWEPQSVQLYAPVIGRTMERVRNVEAARRLRRLTEADTMAARSGTSGRFLQPGPLLYRIAAALLVPFDLLRVLDRGRHGNGIVVLARRVPDGGRPVTTLPAS